MITYIFSKLPFHFFTIVLLCSFLNTVFGAQMPTNSLGTSICDRNKCQLTNTHYYDTPYYRVRDGLAHFYQLAVKKSQINVAFLGGSITYNPGWRQKICAFLTEKFPQAEFRFINAGIPSLGSLAHAFRLQRDVLDSGKIDLMFVEAAVNDRGSGVDSTTQLYSLEGIVRHARRSNPDMDIVFIEFADTYKTTDYDHDKIPPEVARHETVAAYYNLPSVNIAREVADRLRKKEFSWKDDFKDIHPSAFGQELYYQSIRRMLAACFRQSRAKQHISPAPLNPGSFEHGIYYALKNATIDIGWKLYRSWKPANDQPTRDGFVNVPVLTTEKQGSVLKLRFKGTALGIAVISGNDAGIIEYQIDKQTVKQVDLYTDWSSWLHLPYYILLAKDLHSGKHTLSIKLLEITDGNRKGTACRIAHFLINR